MTDSGLVRWRSSDAASILRNIRDFLKILKVDDKGKVSSSEIFAVERFTLVLAHLVQISGIETLEVKKHLINRAFFNRLKTYKRQSISEFRKALAAESRMYFRVPLSNFTTLYPLHVDRNNYDGPGEFYVLGAEIRISSWSEIKDDFQIDDFFRRVSALPHSSHPVVSEDCLPLLVETGARYPNEAFYLAYESAHLLRSILNLQRSIFRGQLEFGYPNSYAEFLPPPAYAVFDSGGKLQQFIYSTDSVWKRGTSGLTTEQCRHAQEFADALGAPGPENEIARFLAQAIGRYGHALDTIDRRSSFLIMWQILEFLTLQSSENFSQKTVMNRINALLKQSNRVKEDMRFLAYVRNKFVHHGDFPDETALEILNILKLVVEQAIVQIFALRTHLPTTASLGRFYDHATESTSGLKDRARIIEFLLERE